MKDLENVKTVLDFLGEENVDKIRQAMTDALIDNLNESIEQEWIVLPETFSVMWDGLAEEVFNKYKPKIKKAMGENIESMLKRLKECKDQEEGE